MIRRLSLEEALKELARARRVKANRKHTEYVSLKPARLANANEEFGEPPSTDKILSVGILIALTLVDLIAVKWL
jgi:hypothetical protein